MSKNKASVPSTPDERLEALRTWPKEDLVALLAELAAKHPQVDERLARHALAGDPEHLARTFGERLRRWRRSGRFLPRSAAGSFGRELEDWLDEIERELLPLDPARAQALAEAFLSSDADFFEHIDDSDGVIGEAIGAGCRLWLRAAKAQPDQEVAHWVDRVHALAHADEYGARQALLAHAELLFEPAGLRALAARFEADLDAALGRPKAGERHNYSVFKASAAIGLIADALRDPDLSTRATLRYSPQPNELQKEKFAARYIRFGRPAEALAWLDGDWGHRDLGRQRLLSEAYAALSETVRLRATLQSIFESTGAASDFAAWRESLAPAERPVADDLARRRAHILDDAISAAELLLALSEAPEAEALLLARHAGLRGEEYYRLLPLAEKLEQRERPLGAVVCYRALLLAILARAYARAYGHGAEYLFTLRRLDTSIHDYGALGSHVAFEADLRTKHGRKVAFWRRLNH